MAANDPNDRRLIASIAANTRWAHEDPATQAVRARRNIEKRFDNEVDPGGKLAPDERARRASRAKSAYFSRLALRSAQARRRVRRELPRP